MNTCMKRVAVACCTVLCALALLPSTAFADNGPSTSTQLTISATANSKQSAASYFPDNSVVCISSALVRNNAYMVDVLGASHAVGANVQLYSSNNTLAQVWRVRNRGNGIYRFQSYAGGRLLSLSNGLRAGSSAVMRDNGYVDWYVQKNADGTFSFSPVQAKNLRLSAASGKAANYVDLRLGKASGSATQKFRIIQLGGATEALRTGKQVAPGMVEMVPQAKAGTRVDVQGQSSAAGANVRLATNSNLSASKKWQLLYAGNGFYELQNVKSGKFLAVEGASGKAGSDVRQRPRNKTLSQFWYLQPAGNGSFRIRSALSGTALEFAGSQNNVQVGAASNKAAQKFSIKKVQLIDNGTYVLSSAVANVLVLDVTGASARDGANVQVYRSNGTGAQKFKITYAGGGAYRITNAVTGKCVEVASASKANCVNVRMYRNNNTKRQLWIPELVSGGMRFKNAATGKYLGVCGAGMRSSTNVWQYTRNGTAAQTWVLHDANWTYYSGAPAGNQRIMHKAEEYEGWPYRWGGRSPRTSFDCAGLVMYCSNVVWGTHFDLEYTNAARLYAKCKKISAKEARPGDLVFYRGTYGNDVRYISHVVFYAGQGLMFGAGSPIGYGYVNSIWNIHGRPAEILYARIIH